MIEDSAKILDLESYRKASAAPPPGAGGSVAPVPAMIYGAMSAAPFAIPMAFLTAWPAFVFWPLAGQIRGRIGDGRDGAERNG
ncbi:MAG: hypothetical protein P4M07_18400 [Xanthobacteraceae bacterium]|nr:hypothetical protein [Xanthobacteraceae bacterium]